MAGAASRRAPVRETFPPLSQSLAMPERAKLQPLLQSDIRLLATFVARGDAQSLMLAAQVLRWLDMSTASAAQLADIRAAVERFLQACEGLRDDVPELGSSMVGHMLLVLLQTLFGSLAAQPPHVTSAVATEHGRISLLSVLRCLADSDACFARQELADIALQAHTQFGCTSLSLWERVAREVRMHGPASLLVGACHDYIAAVRPVYSAREQGPVLRIDELVNTTRLVQACAGCAAARPMSAHDMRRVLSSVLVAASWFDFQLDGDAIRGILRGLQRNAGDLDVGHMVQLVDVMCLQQQLQSGSAAASAAALISEIAERASWAAPSWPQQDYTGTLCFQQCLSALSKLRLHTGRVVGRQAAAALASRVAVLCLTACAEHQGAAAFMRSHALEARVFDARTEGWLHGARGPRWLSMRSLC